MKFISLFSGCGGFDLGFERAGLKCIGQVEIMPYALKILNKHWPSVPKHMDALTFCVRDGLVKTIQLRGEGRVWPAKEAGYGMKSKDSLDYSVLRGLSEKMFADFFLLEMEKIFGQSYPTWIRSGIVWRGECWTVNSLEFPNDARESTLLEVLETQVPQKYYLSRQAVQGIIRRSQLKGKCCLLETGGTSTKILSVAQLEQMCGVNLSKYGQKILLRRLTPVEKERLQGFPEGWTLTEE